MSLETKRIDGRSVESHRPVSIALGELQRVDGSARFAFGSTIALASVSGPIEVRLSAEQASKATFEVSVRPLAGVPGTETKSLSVQVKDILTPSLLLTHNPRTLIQLIVQSCSPVPSSSSRIRTPPSLIAAMINTSSLALLNASSCPMSGVVCASSVGRLRSTPNSEQQDVLIVDPSDEESRNLDGGGVFAFLFSGNKPVRMVWTNWTVGAGAAAESEFAQAKEMARRSAGVVLGLMKDAVAERAVVKAKSEDVKMEI